MELQLGGRAIMLLPNGRGGWDVSDKNLNEKPTTHPHPHPHPCPKAQARPGLGKSGDLEMQKFRVHKMNKNDILKCQIRSAQNVGKVWISWEKSSWPHLGPCGPNFCAGRKIKLCPPIFLGGPMDPIQSYSPGLGSCAGVMLNLYE